MIKGALNKSFTVSKALRGLCIIVLLFGLTDCAKQSQLESENNQLSETVAEVGDSILTVTDVICRIPVGITPTDSAMLFDAIVDGWIERLLLDKLGQDNIDDMHEIERMVDQYRRKLIVASYRRSLRASHRWKVPEDSVRSYWSLHRPEFVLGRPVIKGLYVKVPSDVSRLSDIRRWMQTATPDAIDNLEKYGLRDAVEYSFFIDKWTDWNVLSRQIPYSFGNPDDFVAHHRNFETVYGGMAYILHITAFLPSGEQMPYEVAAPLIAEVLEADAGETYERRLIAGLYARARKEGSLRDYRKNLKTDKISFLNKTE